MTIQIKGIPSLMGKLTLVVMAISIFSFATGITSVTETIQYVNNYINYEPKSNLEVSVITEPPTKLSKDSSFIYEFNICNKGKTGEEYNYSLEMNNIMIYNEFEKIGRGLLNDGEACEVIEYKLYPKSKYSSQKYYSDIEFSIKVNSESLNKLLFYKIYKYSLNDEGLYELE